MYEDIYFSLMRLRRESVTAAGMFGLRKVAPGPLPATLRVQSNSLENVEAHVDGIHLLGRWWRSEAGIRVYTPIAEPV